MLRRLKQIEEDSRYSALEDSGLPLSSNANGAKVEVYYLKKIQKITKNICNTKKISNFVLRI